MPTVSLTANADTIVVTQDSSNSQWNNWYDGLAGIDIIDLTSHPYRSSTFSSFYTLSANADGVITLSSVSGGNKTMTFTNFEILKIGTSVFNLGTTANDTITGGTLNDKWLYGLSGNDTLDGGLGADTMYGGAGEDTYIVDNVGDIVSERVNEGIDLVKSSVTISSLVANVENLLLTGTTAINGTGNTLDNMITGNSAANTLTGGGGNDTISGGGGSDTVVMSGLRADYTVTQISTNVYQITDNTSGRDGTDALTDIANVQFSDGTFAIGTLVPSVINGTAGNDTLNGTSANDTINGLAGNDTIDGGAGTDTLVGGAGDDTYVIDTATDTITEAANQGTDTVKSSVTIAALAANVENLILTLSAVINGTGNELDNAITGNSAANMLSGGGGNDRLDGGAGDDTLVGGAGDDIYVVDSVNDIITEGTNEGTDAVESSVTLTLNSNLENLKLTGASAINGTGNGLANIIIGNAANNTLDGGAGNDVLAGGAGDDTYVVDTIGDVVTEASGEGIDIIKSSVTLALASNVENMTLTGSAAINGTGNVLANIITGNGSNNVLDGGAGGDTLAGGAGDDTYVIDSTSDIVTENAGEGFDVVQASTSFALGANIEDLILTGTAAVNGTGNALSNAITGNAASNILDGGANDDTLVGGAGDDTYIVDSTNDVVSEVADAGVDVVQSSASFTLDANLENLTLTGSAAVNGTGNRLSNVITGNLANNLLAGGAGDDIISGGGGSDTLILSGAKANYTITEGGATVTFADNRANADGTDTVSGITFVQFSDGTFTLDSLLNSTTVIDGTSGDDILTGTASDETINGLAGNDSLDGNGGADTLVGGVGNDTYFVDSSDDLVVEQFGGGTDIVNASISLLLAADIENLTLTGASGINGTGNALANIITGNAANNILDGGAGDDWLSGGTGDDTYVVDSAGDMVTEAANEGTDIIRSSITLLLADHVENLTLVGSTAINGTGNAMANVITGNMASNTLDGNGGEDSLAGGAGDDTYVVDSEGDVVTEVEAEGTDTVQALMSFALGAHIEDLTLIGDAALNGIGNALANTITGNAANNTLDGGAGDDTLIGGAGDDTLVGGGGIDTIVFSGAKDDYTISDDGGTVTISDGRIGGDGTDIVSNITYVQFEDGTVTLASLILREIEGTDGNDVLIGTAAAETIYGLAGDDMITGNGGADTLIGGEGDDTYVVDSADSIVIELPDEGIDTLRTSANLGVLADSIENLQLTGAAVSATGNDLDNQITGNASDNTIDGGDGHDTAIFTGAKADYTFSSSLAGQIVIEDGTAGRDGTDTFINVESFAFANGVFTFDELMDTTIMGTDASETVSGTNANDVMHGLAGNDLLNGGAGSDTMYGGRGNDTFIVDSAGDTVIELASEGIDLVKSTVSKVLGAYCENLTLTGTATTFGTGNGLANKIIGNSAANRLTGGYGKDNLTGGAGRDVFDFNMIKETGKTSTTRDIITDFQHYYDKIDLSTLDANAYVAGNSAFKFIGKLGFTHHAGELRYGVFGSTTIISGDNNGDAVADFQIQLTGAKLLTLIDFVL